MRGKRFDTLKFLSHKRGLESIFWIFVVSFSFFFLVARVVCRLVLPYSSRFWSHLRIGNRVKLIIVFGLFVFILKTSLDSF